MWSRAYGAQRLVTWNHASPRRRGADLLDSYLVTPNLSTRWQRFLILWDNIVCPDNCKVNSRITVFKLQSNLPGMCALMHLIGHCSACQIMSHGVGAKNEPRWVHLYVQKQRDWAHWNEWGDFFWQNAAALGAAVSSDSDCWMSRAVDDRLVTLLITYFN